MFGSLQYKVPTISRGKGTELQDSTGHFAVTNGSYTDFQWWASAANYDELSAFNPSTHNTKIVIQQEGWYIVTGQVFHGNHVNNTPGVKIVLNSTVIGVQETGSNHPGGSSNTTFGALCYCVAGDTIKISLFSSNTGGTETPNNMYFNVVKLN